MLKRVSESVTPITMGSTSTPSTTTNTTSAPATKTPVQNQQLSGIKNKIEKAVSESTDLISALECVGAMYGIPSTNIIADDTATNIRVVNDNIIAPPLEKPNGQIKPIMAAIGSVLDYISQRIDDKLNTYQQGNIDQGRIEDSMAHANPNKGTVIGRYADSDGNEVLVYNTGIVDMANTPAGRAKVDELRKSNLIPDYNPSPAATAPSYFSDEDDISSEVDMDASPNTGADEASLEVNDVAENIQESAYHLNMISKFNNTTHLGYDILQKHGFDFIKPIDSIIQESDTSDDGDKKKKKKVRVEDIKYMKFDNKNIIDAVKYFNKARDEQDTAKNGKMDIKKFINDPNYEKAIDCLNKQFNCRINLRYFKTGQSTTSNAGTFIYNDFKKKLTVSKSKGFQLGGLPIEIHTSEHYFEDSAPEDLKLFGQNLVSTICHEIFHNIAYVMRKENAQMGMSLAMTLNIAANAKTMKDRRVIITNYVDTLDEVTGNKFINKLAKKKLVKQLMTLTTIQDNEALVREVQKNTGSKNNDADEYMESLIKRYKKSIRKVKPSPTRYVFPVVASAASIVAGVLLASPASVIQFASFGVGATMGLLTLSRLSVDTALISMKKQYSKSNIYEEYYCDLFAAMYKLPKFFFVGNPKKKYVTNDFKDEKIEELAKLEKDLYEAIFCSYPTDLERTHAGVKVAKNLLKDDKNLDPSLKKYCQWIVNNFTNIDKANIDKLYNKTTFDPKEAEDLDKHLTDLITNNNLVLTESFIQWLNEDTISFYE